MNFGEALELLKRGEKIARLHWLEYGDIRYIFLRGKAKACPVFVSRSKEGLDDVWAISHRDLIADDWFHYDKNIAYILVLESEIYADVERGNFHNVNEQLIRIGGCVGRINPTYPAYQWATGKLEHLFSFVQLRRSRLQKE